VADARKGRLVTRLLRAYLLRPSAEAENRRPSGGEPFGSTAVRDDGMNAIVDDLSEYRARVVHARVTDSSETIHNSSDRHAAVLIEQLFVAAKQRARVVCRRLNAAVWGAPLVIAAASRFLAQPGARLEIIVGDPESVDFATHPFLVEFAKLSNVDIRAMDRSVDPGLDLFVVDEKAYRFEPDPNVPIARASFNREEIGKTLVSIFESTHQFATRITA